MKKLTLITLVLVFTGSLIKAQNPINELYKGEKDGKATSHYNKRKLETECDVLNGNIQGQRLTYHKNGKLWVREKFDKGRYNGTKFLLKKNGDTSFVEIYKYDTLIYSKNFEYNSMGKLTSTSSVWYEPDRAANAPYADKIRYVVQANSSLLLDLNRVEQIYNNHGIYQEYYKNGNVKLQAHTKKVFYTGSYFENYKNGTLKKEATYVDGKLTGPYKEYYPDGKIKIKTTYKDDNLNGEYFEYDKEGKEKRSNFKNGIPAM